MNLYICLCIWSIFYTIATSLFANTILSKKEPQIFGGSEVKNRSEFAYQALLVYKEEPYCGATIIDEKHVLTAGHCCYRAEEEVNPSELTIVAGNLELNDKSVEKKVTDIFIHEQYKYLEGQLVLVINDIAALRIEDNFDFTDDIQPIQLTTDNLITGNCNVSGWGVTFNESNNMNEKLLYAEIPIFDWNSCNTIYENLTENQICAGGNMKDFCRGDSGGPLVCNGGLTGIASFGMACDNSSSAPGAYTEVAKYLEWIETQKTRSAAFKLNVNLFLFFLFVLIQYRFL